MVDPALVYVSAVVLLFFFWIYGIVSFALDVKHYLIPAYRQWRRDGEQGTDAAGPAEEGAGDGEHRDAL